jgi:hypothetical protein
MSHESLAEKAVRVLAIIAANETMLHRVNDIGDATGYCQEHAQIVNDLHAVLGSFGARAYNLKQRYDRSDRDNKTAHHRQQEYEKLTLAERVAAINKT